MKVQPYGKGLCAKPRSSHFDFIDLPMLLFNESQKTIILIETKNETSQWQRICLFMINTTFAFKRKR